MTHILRTTTAILVALSLIVLHPGAHAAPSASEIGVVVMHGKGGRPGKFVDELAAALEGAGFQVANLEMPWSGRRQYDTNMQGAVDEITRAFDAMRAKGAHKLFVAGHSQGGMFALHYAGVRRVDGVLAIAPGGQVDASSFAPKLAAHVQKAREMVENGQGAEKASFSDYESSRGTNPITTTAAIYLDWFDPNGSHTSRIFGRVQEGTPVLYVAPTRDYPGLAKGKERNFGALPSHTHKRLYQPDSDHLHAPGAAASEAILWIRQVSER